MARKYNYEGFTDVEKEITKKLKEIRSLIVESFSDIDYIDMCMFKHNGYISVIANDNLDVTDKDNFINTVVWDKEGIDDEQTNTDE